MRRPFTPVNELKIPDVRVILGEIQIDRNRISLQEVLMEGQSLVLKYAIIMDELVSQKNELCNMGLNINEMSPDFSELA